MSKALPPRLHRNKAGNYYVLFSKNGRSERKSLRTDDPHIAQLRYEGWMEGYRTNNSISSDPLICDVLEWWMDQWIVGRMKSENRYPSLVKNLNSYFGKMRVSEINADHSRDYARMRTNLSIGRNRAASGTIRRELESLRAALNFMVKKVEPRDRRLRMEALPYVDLPPESPPRDRVLSTDELQKLRDACLYHFDTGKTQVKSNRMSRVSRFVWLAMETAARKTSLLELKWAKVDFDLNLINLLPDGERQSSKKRPTLPIGTSLRDFLLRAYNERINDYVLDKKTSIDHQLQILASSLNIHGLTPHVFRHTWATHKAMAGVPMKKIAQFLGDTEETVKKNYEHLSPDFLRDVVD